MMKRLVGVMAGIGVMLALATVTYAEVDPTALNGWSDWGSWQIIGGNPYNFQLSPERSNALWQSNWGTGTNDPGGENNRNQQQKGPYAPGSGGEWYDIEGLYMDVVQVTTGVNQGKSYLNWLLITSYTGLEPGEWKPSTGTGGAVSNGAGPYAYIRDHGSPGDGSGDGGPVPWAYRSNPVIGLNLSAGSPVTEETKTGYEWGLVLDMTEECNTLQYGGTPLDITTRAGLYQTRDTSYWEPWVSPPYNEFPQNRPSDLDTRNLTADRTGGIGSSKKMRIIGQPEANGMTNGFTPQPYNWAWEGYLDVTGSSFLAALNGQAATSIHYALWCGNDYMDLKGTREADLTNTPELSSGVLLLVGALPIGLGWLRRRKTA